MVKKKKAVDADSKKGLTIDKNPIVLNPLKCRNDKQKQFIKVLKDKNKSIVICDGIAGSGKTFLALYQGVLDMLEGAYEKVILCKSVIAIPNESIGYLPGSVSEKMEPHIMSYTLNLEKMVNNKDNVKRLFNEGKIQIMPFEYIRGNTFDNAYIIVDETQNITMELFTTVITRLGLGSKIVFLGDIEQVDFSSQKNKDMSSLKHIITLFDEKPDIATYVHFTDEECVRNPIIPKVLNEIRDWQDKNKK